MTSTVLSFTERLRRRKSLWDQGLFWQRQLANKLTAKLFALRAGVPVPKLFWSGNDYRELPPGNLPDTFVMKPLYGHSAKGVIPVQHGINNRNGSVIDWSQVRSKYRAYPRGALIEEYMPTSNGKYDAIEGFKVFVFGPACVIRYNRECFDKATGKISCLYETYCREDWTPIKERLSTYAPQGPPPPPMPCADQALDFARRLGKGYETFVRVDFYITPDGPRFGEFCPFPYDGKHWTDLADQLFGSLWERHLGATP